MHVDGVDFSVRRLPVKMMLAGSSSGWDKRDPNEKHVTSTSSGKCSQSHATGPSLLNHDMSRRLVTPVGGYSRFPRYLPSTKYRDGVGASVVSC